MRCRLDSLTSMVPRSFHDSQTEIWAVSSLLTKERRVNRKTSKSRNLFDTGAGKATRAGSSIFQKALNFRWPHRPKTHVRGGNVRKDSTHLPKELFTGMSSRL